MGLNKLVTITICSLLAISLVGCAQDYGQYAQAIKEQNLTRQLYSEQQLRHREFAQRKHEEKMAVIAGQLIIAANKSESPNDDMMVPLVLMMMEDKWSMAQASNKTEPMNFVTIQPPETTGELIQKSTGLLLGLGALGLSAYQTYNLSEVAKTGINSAGTKVSGSNNSITGDYGTANGDTVNTTHIVPESSMYLGELQVIE